MARLADIKFELKLHPHVRTLEDEWSGVTAPAVRRKLQNRLNQRAARRRKEKAIEESGLSGPADGVDEIGIMARIDESPIGQNVVGLSHRKESVSETRLVQESRKSMLSDPLPSKLEQLVDTDWRVPFRLPADHLLSLIYYNVFRAFVLNTELVGLPFASMCKEDYTSPFVGKLTDDPSFHKLPESLRPTYLQCEVPHHPMWDIFPDPLLRDKVMAVYGQEVLDEDEVCLNICGYNAAGDPLEPGQSSAGMIVWGDPWDVRSWEVTEAFAGRWKIFVEDAFLLLISSNEWRRGRGEPPLKLDLVGSAMCN